MIKKTISELIFDKFSDYIKGDDLFKDVSNDLIFIIKQKKCSKTEIEHLLKKSKNEDSGTEN